MRRPPRHACRSTAAERPIVAVDNTIYDRLRASWWDEEGALSVLRTAMNPVRFAYLRGVLETHVRRPLQRVRILDIGCGGGLLAEEFARLGCQVVGVDPSRGSLEVAREHARGGGLAITYTEGCAE